MQEEKINIISKALEKVSDSKFNDIALFLINNAGISFNSIYSNLILTKELLDHEYNIVMHSKVLLDDKTLEEEIDVYQKKIDALKLHKANRENSNGDKYF